MKKLISQFRTFRENHKWFSIITEHTVGIIICAFTALVISIAIRSFVAPNQVMDFAGTAYEPNLPRLIAGGANGISQVIVKIIQLFGIDSFTEDAAQIAQWIIYAVVNIPLVIIAFMKIGKKFAIYTVINVGLTTLFSLKLPNSVFNYIAINFEGSFLPRAIFGGMMMGLASGVSFRFGQSTGGMDIVGHLLASRKSTSTGKFSLVINFCIMAVFVILSIIRPDKGQLNAMRILSDNIGLVWDPTTIPFDARVGFFIVIIFCSFTYLLVSSFVVDIINLRNKKEMIQIITRNKEMADVLVHSFRHGVTSMAGRGEYTKEQKLVILMTVSHYETPAVIALIRENDPEAFINVTNLRQVYGRFYIPPIK